MQAPYGSTRITAYSVTDGESVVTFRYVDPSASRLAAFAYAAKRNAERDRWAAHDPEGERLNTNGRRYTVTEYRALWNGVPVDEA